MDCGTHLLIPKIKCTQLRTLSTPRFTTPGIYTRTRAILEFSREADEYRERNIKPNTRMQSSRGTPSLLHTNFILHQPNQARRKSRELIFEPASTKTCTVADRQSIILLSHFTCLNSKSSALHAEAEEPQIIRLQEHQGQFFAYLLLDH